MSSNELITTLTSGWEANDLSEFMSIFHEDAKIYHPYFQVPISPLDAMEIMNTAVSGNTSLEKFKLVAGDGSGKDDLLEIEILEAGDRIPFVSYVGIMCMTFKITDHKFSFIKINSGRVKKIREKKINIVKKVGSYTSLELSQKLATFWGSNMSEEYYGLFSNESKIKHILFAKAYDPEIVIDIMNCNVLGTTELYGFQIIRGTGKGIDDQLELKFLETGDLIGYTPENQGVMRTKAIVKNHQIEYLEVYGYDIVQNKVEEEIQ